MVSGSPPEWLESSKKILLCEKIHLHTWSSSFCISGLDSPFLWFHPWSHRDLRESWQMADNIPSHHTTVSLRTRSRFMLAKRVCGEGGNHWAWHPCLWEKGHCPFWKRYYLVSSISNSIHPHSEQVAVVLQTFRTTGTVRCPTTTAPILLVVASLIMIHNKKEDSALHLSGSTPALRYDTAHCSTRSWGKSMQFALNTNCSIKLN